MRRSLCALIAVPVALATAAPALAAGQKDAFNSSGLRKAVTLDGIREHQRNLQFIADANEGVRTSGTPGYDASAAYVKSRLETAGYDVTLQEFPFDYFKDTAPPEFDRVSPDAEAYETPEEFTTMTYSGSGDATAETVHVTAGAGSPGPGCSASDVPGSASGKVVLVQRGGCPFKTKAINAQDKGAAAVVIYNNVGGPLNGTLGSIGQSIPVIGTTQAIGQEQVALLAGGPVTLHVAASTLSDRRTTRNVIADTGGDASRTVVVGAHLDSVAQGPGINDNGSGSATILEIAEQFAKRGIDPSNRVRFAWWGAEEYNLVGSTFYVDQLSPAALEDHLANLNFDMVGSPNYVRFVYDGDNSAYPPPGAATGPDGSGQIESVFVSYFRNQGLQSDPTPFSGRSDYGPFIGEGIPAGGLFTGAEGEKTERQAEIYGGTAGQAYDPCYHQACDTFANNSDRGLDEMSDAAAHATYTYALTEEAVTNGGRLKPGRNGTPAAANSPGPGNSTDGGHDDHAVAARAGKRPSDARARRSIKRLKYYGSLARR
jgi:Zn-dependent M28 family amino/carboxypeptidase